MRAIPLHDDFGAEIRDVSLVDVGNSAAAYAEVRAAFERYSVLLFRDQQVDDAIQAVYSRAFGPLELTKVGSLGEGGFFVRLTNIGPEGTLVGPTHREALVARANQLWHTDSSFKKLPALASVLSARTIPTEGGETEFASTRAAWQRLPEARRARLADLVVSHSYAASRDQIDPTLMTPAERASLPVVRWRLTWPNPANGLRSLYVASHAFAIEGMAQAEARALLDELIALATAPGRTWLHRWRAGDVLMWDNRATMHRGRPWPDDQPRYMVRTTISATEADGLERVRPPAPASERAAA